MKQVREQIREARRELGITQIGLSRASRASLASIQNLEAGRANPSLSMLRRILEPLGLEFGIGLAAANWEALIDHGLPLSGAGSRRRRPTLEGLLRHLRLAAREVSGGERPDDDGRKRECLQALVLAIQTSFPTIFREQLAGSPLIARLLSSAPSGRLIKLKRIAEASLAGYL